MRQREHEVEVERDSRGAGRVKFLSECRRAYRSRLYSADLAPNPTSAARSHQQRPAPSETQTLRGRGPSSTRDSNCIARVHVASQRTEFFGCHLAKFSRGARLGTLGSE